MSSNQNDGVSTPGFAPRETIMQVEEGQSTAAASLDTFDGVVVPTGGVRLGPGPLRTAFENNVDSVRNADVVVLSTKPQNLPTVLPELRGALRESALAGVSR